MARAFVAVFFCSIFCCIFDLIARSFGVNQRRNLIIFAKLNFNHNFNGPTRFYCRCHKRVNVFANKHTHTDTDTHTQTQAHTDAHTHAHTDAHTHAQSVV